MSAGADHGFSGCPACSLGAGLAVEDRNPPHMTRRSLLQLSAAAGAGLGATVASGQSGNAPAAHDVPAADKPLIIEPSWVLAWEQGNFRLLRDHSVVVEGGRIADIRQGHRTGRDQRLRCPGQLLTPGFVSGHTHTNIIDFGRGTVGFRGRPGNPIRLGDLLEEEDRHDLTRYRLAESLRGGCTTRFEQALSLAQGKAHLAAAQRYQTREYLSAMTPGWSRLFPIWLRDDDQALFDSEAETLAEIAAIREWSLAANNTEGGRIQMQMGPHAPNTLTPKAMQAIGDAAKELGNGIHTHLSQDAREIDHIQRLWNKKPTEWIDEFGWYDGPLIAAHLRGMDPAVELPILVEKGATFGYCPWEGGIDGTTVPRWWPEVLAAGMNASIGIEFSADYVENIKLAVLYGGARYSLLPHPDVSPVALKDPNVWDALRAATVNGAAIVGRQDIGRIAVGAKADLATINLTGYLLGCGAVPPQPVYNLLFANGLSVVHVMTEGQIQIFNGHFVLDDEQRMIERASAVMEKVWAEAESAGWFDHAPA
jgi:5-methylthioadenosine/S-adenosylhomocysteine deaminase